MSDEDLSARVSAEVDSTIDASRQPVDVRLRRWEQALPVFGLGHAVRVATARRSLSSNIALAGAYLEVREQRFDRNGIRQLYDNEEFPLQRRKVAS